MLGEQNPAYRFAQLTKRPTLGLFVFYLHDKITLWTKKRLKNTFWVIKILNKKNIIPVLYGSLGLYQIIEPLGTVDDIDFLVKEVWITDKWDELRSCLEKYEFKLEDEHEHEFSHPLFSSKIAFGSIEESGRHSGLNLEKARLVQGKIKYYTLTAQQYLSAYKACLKDDYRQGKKGDADIQKIKALEEYLNV